MMRRRRVATIVLLLVCATGIAACGDAEDAPSAGERQVLRYSPGRRLHPRVTERHRVGPLRVEQLTYASVDGQRVPALFAVPTATPPLGCLMYQGGLGATKESFPELRSGLAHLHLATFSIDPREGGARGSVAAMTAAIKQPETLRALVLNTVADLRMGLDYLDRRPECHDNIAYMGTSFGAAVGALFAAQDPRIKATVLTSVGPTYKAAMLTLSEAAKTTPDVPVQVPGAATDAALLARAVRILSPIDPARWIGRIAPRPLMLLNGRHDPLVAPIDALEVAAAAGDPKTVVYFYGGHDPFAKGPDRNSILLRTARFLADGLGLPTPF